MNDKIMWSYFQIPFCELVCQVTTRRHRWSRPSSWVSGMVWWPIPTATSWSSGQQTDRATSMPPFCDECPACFILDFRSELVLTSSNLCCLCFYRTKHQWMAHQSRPHAGQYSEDQSIRAEGLQVVDLWKDVKLRMKKRRIALNRCLLRFLRYSCLKIVPNQTATSVG